MDRPVVLPFARAQRHRRISHAGIASLVDAMQRIGSLMCTLPAAIGAVAQESVKATVAFESAMQRLAVLDQRSWYESQYMMIYAAARVLTRDAVEREYRVAYRRWREQNDIRYSRQVPLNITFTHDRIEQSCTSNAASSVHIRMSR